MTRTAPPYRTALPPADRPGDGGVTNGRPPDDIDAELRAFARLLARQVLREQDNRNDQ